MEKDTILMIEDFFRKNPIAKGEPATREEIAKAEKELCLKFQEDYVFFLLNYGGSMIKNKEIYGFHNSELMDDTDIVELTELFREDDGNEKWLIIGTDYCGNSIGMDENGKILVHDHDVGEDVILGETFEDYILKIFSKDV